MLFQISRIALAFILAAVGVIWIGKSAIRRKKRAVALAVVGAILISLFTSTFPIENILFRFDTPESVFSYAFVYKIRNTLQGNDSCMIVYSNNSENSEGFHVIPKAGKGYAIPTPFTTKMSSRQVGEKGSVVVYRVNGCGDCYLVAVIPYGIIDSEAADAKDVFGEVDGIRYLLVSRSSVLEVYVYTNGSVEEAIQKIIEPLFEKYLPA